MSWRDDFPGFRLRPTRWGFVYLGATLILGMAAVNTGNNALIAILGLALGAYAVSGFWSRQVLANFEVEAVAPRELFAGRPAVFDVIMRNRSRWLPGLGLIVRDGAGRVVAAEATVPARGVVRHSVQRVFDRRGRQPVGPWRLEVLLPLGFFLKSKEVVRSLEVVVFPRLLPTAASPERRHRGQRASARMEDRGREGEVSQLRDWRDGDDRRLVHWKQTARQQRLIVVERQRATEEPVVLVLDPRAPEPDLPATRDRFERLVSEVATAVVERLRAGAAVGLVIGRRRYPPVAGLAHGARLLTPLAEVALAPMTAPAPAAPVLRRATRFALREIA